MFNKKLKIKIVIVSALTLFAFLTTSFAIKVLEETTSWLKSYEDYRKHIKSLPADEVKKCETALREILRDLDSKDHCEIDSDCTLIEQDPFGDTVPFPVKLVEEMKKKMKDFSESCDDGSYHSVKNSDLVHRPVCWKGKCMVKSSIKDNK